MYTHFFLHIHSVCIFLGNYAVSEYATVLQINAFLGINLQVVLLCILDTHSTVQWFSNRNKKAVKHYYFITFNSFAFVRRIQLRDSTRFVPLFFCIALALYNWIVALKCAVFWNALYKILFSFELKRAQVTSSFTWWEISFSSPRLLQSLSVFVHLFSSTQLTCQCFQLQCNI